ncbi:MAG TPA: ABC transporter permease [Mycobacteriales bacterium]|nr:ABC transporter permease [Mycobacteriales bacterium]
MTTRAWWLVEAQLRRYKHTWRSTAASTMVLPLLLLLVPGLGVGRLVDASHSLGSLRYLNFIAPAVVAGVAMQVALAEATMPVFAGIRITRTTQATLATPITPGDLVDGYLSWILLRTLSTCAVLVVVAQALRAVPLSACVPLLAVAALTALAHAPLLLAFTVRQQDGYTLAAAGRVLVLPALFGAGTFLPTHLLPSGLAAVSRLTPLWHGVQLCRGAVGIATLSPAAVAVHLVVLLGYAAGGYAVARRTFRRRLVP